MDALLSINPIAPGGVKSGCRCGGMTTLIRGVLCMVISSGMKDVLLRYILGRYKNPESPRFNKNFEKSFCCPNALTTKKVLVVNAFGEPFVIADRC